MKQIEARMKLWVLAGVWAAAVTAPAQSLVEPERAKEIERAFAAASSGRSFRCSIRPVHPALNFALQFEAGYRIELSFDQFIGEGRSLTTSLRVTPEGRAPVYLSKDERLPDVPDTKLVGETSGAFVVGEGAYRVDVLLEDDRHRSCRDGFRIQARRSGSETQLAFPTPPLAVQEISDLPAAVRPGPRIGRLTILLHAAPLTPNLSTLQAEDLNRLMASVSSLLAQLPAANVRLIAFNLDQLTVPFRRDSFDAKQLGDLKQALSQLQLAKVDYSTLQRLDKPIDLLLDLIRAETREASPPDAVIVLGGRSRAAFQNGSEGLDRVMAGRPLFSLQFLSHFSRQGVRMGPLAHAPGRRNANDPAIPGAGPEWGVNPPPPQDAIERLIGALKGETLPIRTPHDLVDAIRKMDGRIAKTAAPESRPAADDFNGPAEPSGEEDPAEVLMRLRDQVLRYGHRIPNYTCIETIQRERYEPVEGREGRSCETIFARRRQTNAELRLQLDRTDWLRLDVALAPDREMHSWAGANRFDDRELDELIPNGAISDGSYAAILLSLFETRGPRFVFEGEIESEGRRLFQYSLSVARADSTFRVRDHTRRGWVIAGYDGTMLVDPKTAELARLISRTEELPAETAMCQTEGTLDYGVVQLGSSPYLLPKRARQRFIDRDGAESENLMTFASCREYHAESSVSFDEGAGASARRRSAPAPGTGLPENLPVTIELTTTVRPGESAAGDRIEGRFAKAIVDAHQKILVPEGAAVAGRLMRVEVRHAARPELEVALRWETVKVGEAVLPLALIPNRKMESGARTNSGLLRRGREIELPAPGEERYAVFHFFGGRAALESGARSEWFTIKPE